MNPTDADWWWQIALDGVVGGLLGGALAGLVAWWAVRRTVRHERDLARLSDVRSDLGPLYGAVNAWLSDERDEFRERERLEELWRTLAAAEPLASAFDEQLGSDLASFGKVISGGLDPKGTAARSGDRLPNPG